MARFLRRKFSWFLCGVFVIFIIGFCFVKISLGEEKTAIKIFPIAYNSEWENTQTISSRDLTSSAELGEFNMENSTYPLIAFPEEESLSAGTEEIIPEATTTDATATEELSTTTSELATTTEAVSTTTEATTTEATTTEATTTEEEISTTTQESATSSEETGFLHKLWLSFKNLFRGEAKAKLEDISFDGQLISVEKILDVFQFLVLDDVKEKEIKSTNLNISFGTRGEPKGKLIINYYYLDSWYNLADIELDNELSNGLNGGYFAYSLPFFNNWEEIENLKIQFIYSGFPQFTSGQATLFLDSVWLEAEYEKKEPVEPIEPEPQAIGERKNFKSNEEPEFDLGDDLSQKKGFFTKVRSLFGKEGREIILIDPGGKESSEGLFVQDNKIKILRSADERSFIPGLYKLKIKSGGEEIIQEFTWGVLAINTNKSIYLSGEQAYLQMASLNDSGHTLCDSNLKLEIIAPNGKLFSVSIEKSGDCGSDNVTSVPDYFAYYQIGELGAYQMELTNLDNDYEIKDFFEVKESVPFEVERIGPTRINPLSIYQTTLWIKANQDWRGEIVEYVPDSFIVNSQFPNYNFQTISNDQNSKQLIWQVDWKAGEEYELNYQFDAPDISPYLYILGPLKIGDFQEARQWQIAADATNMLLFWARATAPTDWSFVDDGAGEPFYNGGTNNVFPRGNSSYGVLAGGAADHTHTATPAADSSGQTGGTTKKAGTAAGTVARFAHIHAVSGTASLASISNLPAYKNLRVIRYNNGIPTSIPEGAIAIFDGSLPASDWLSHFATSGINYVAGFLTSGGTGGSNSHDGVGHTITNLTLDTNTLTGTLGGSTANTGTLNHTHTACSTNNTTDVPPSEPPYINVLLGIATTNTSIPTNMIAMFDGAPGTNWSVLSDVGGAFYQEFLKSASAYSVGAGANPTHSHAGVTCTSDGFAASVVAGTGTNGYTMSGTHTHTTAVTINAAVGTTLPPYTNVIIAKYTVSISCTTDLNGTQTSFGDITDSTLVYYATSSVTTVTSGSTVYMKAYDSGDTVANPGLYKAAGAVLIESPAATSTLAGGTEGYGIVATTTKGTIEISYWYGYSSSTVPHVIGGLKYGSGRTVASSGSGVAGDKVRIDYEAAVALTTPAGHYVDTVTIECSTS